MTYQEFVQQAKELGIKFIGVKKENWAKVIEEAKAQQQLKLLETQSKEEMDQAIEKLELEATEAIAQETKTITVEQLALELGITAKALRKQLRSKGVQKPGKRWEWTTKDPIIETIRSWKKEPKQPLQ